MDILTGSDAINATGNALNNTLEGNAAANKLNGQGGADTMLGGAGDDTYYVDVAGDTVMELSDEGTDTVNAFISYTLGANVENLTLYGTAAINGTGNALNNKLIGNAAANTLTGGLGDDLYYVDNVGDVVVELANEGVDGVNSYIDYTLGANVENLSLYGTAALNGTGNALNNKLLGNAADNILSGGAGNDVLNAGAGNDTLMGGQGDDILIGGAGNDSYKLTRGDGRDTVQENDATAGNFDTAWFDTNILAEQLWFRQSANNLEVSVIGTNDKLILSNWYLGSQYHVEQFKAGDGKVLLDTQVNNLVNAMASFSPPAAGQTSLSPSMANSLQPVLAANWH